MNWQIWQRFNFCPQILPVFPRESSCAQGQIHMLRSPSDSCSLSAALCLRCCVSLWGYLTLTSFTWQPLLLVCEDPCASLSDLSNNTCSWNRVTVTDAVEWARQLRLLWKPRLYTHTQTCLWWQIQNMPQSFWFKIEYQVILFAFREALMWSNPILYYIKLVKNTLCRTS